MHTASLFRRRLYRELPPIANFWQLPPGMERALWFAIGAVATFALLLVRATLLSHLHGGVWVRWLP
jgi:hypothetical protein